MGENKSAAAVCRVFDNCVSRNTSYRVNVENGSDRQKDVLDQTKELVDSYVERG